MVQHCVPAGTRVPDIAAAQSNFSLALAGAAYNLIWTDMRSDLLDYVKLKAERSQVSYTPSNALELPFAQPFGAALIAGVIEHVAHPDQFMAKVAELVKPGDVIINPLTNGHLKATALLAVLTRSWAQLIKRLTQRWPSAMQQKLLIQIGVVFRKPLSTKL